MQVMRINLLTFIIFFSAFVFADCNSLFLPPPEKPVAFDLAHIKSLKSENPLQPKIHEELLRLYQVSKDYEDVSDVFLKDLRSASNKLKLKLKSQPQNSSVRTFDYIFVGAGIHTGITKAALAQSLGQDFSHLRILTVEASNDISVFGRLGKTFRGNTLEHPQLGSNQSNSLSRNELIAESRNFQPGASVQVADVADQQVPIASHFQVPAVTNHWLYGSNFLFETPVSHITKIKNASDEILYKIETSTGETFFSRHVVLGTGLGKPKLPTKDPVSMNFIESQNNTKYQKVFFVEDLLEQINQKRLSGQNFLRPFAGKKVIVVGGGHGAAIGIEAIEGLGPKPLYESIGEVNKELIPSKYTWVNLKASTGDEFKQVIGGGSRYFSLAPLIDSKKIKTNQFYIAEILPTEKGIKVSYLDKQTQQLVRDDQGKILYEEADYLIYATGYETHSNSILKAFAASDGVRYEPVLEEIQPVDRRLYTESQVTVANQVFSNQGEAESIYVIGPGAGPIAHPQDPGGTTSVTMNVFAARSQAMGKALARQHK